MKASSSWFFCRLSFMSRAAYSPLPLPPCGGPFGPSSHLRTTTPSADFCRPVRMNRSILSPDIRDKRQISRGKFDRLPHATAGFTTSALDGYGLRESIARSSGTVCLISGSCTSARAFAPRFFQTPPRGDALALRYDFTSIRLSRGLSPPSCRTCSAHLVLAPFAETKGPRLQGRNPATQNITRPGLIGR